MLKFNTREAEYRGRIKIRKCWISCIKAHRIQDLDHFDVELHVRGSSSTRLKVKLIMSSSSRKLRKLIEDLIILNYMCLMVSKYIL